AEALARAERVPPEPRRRRGGGLGGTTDGGHVRDLDDLAGMDRDAGEPVDDHEVVDAHPVAVGDEPQRVAGDDRTQGVRLGGGELGGGSQGTEEEQDGSLRSQGSGLRTPRGATGNPNAPPMRAS